jgi:hypothetical protein
MDMTNRTLQGGDSYQSCPAGIKAEQLSLEAKFRLQNGSQEFRSEVMIYEETTTC